MSIDRDYERGLWLRLADGDVSAREELIVSYRPLVFWIARKIYVSDDNLRQDIVQEGMLALIKAVDSFDPQKQCRFTTYAYHKIHGAVINLLERSEKRAPIPVPDEYLCADYEQQGGEDWIDAEQAVSRLQGREADIVRGLFFDGKRPKDIAREKSLDVSHIYRLRRSALAKLRGWLGIEGA